MRIGFTQKAQNALNRALYYACEMGHTCVGSEHLLLGLASQEYSAAAGALRLAGADGAAIREAIARREMRLIRRVCEELREMPSVRLYAPPRQEEDRVPVLSLNVADVPSERVAEAMNARGIAVRAGLHCAPAAHERFATAPSGTVRLSPGAFSTPEEARGICEFFRNFLKKPLHTMKNMV